jgi:acetyl esterase/lipase
MLTIWALLTLLALHPMDAHSAPPKEPLSAVQRVADVTYFEGKGADADRHKLDLYLPKDCKQFPVLILVHGGTWFEGDKSFFGHGKDIGTWLAGQGVGVVMPSYRLAPNAAQDEQAQDIARVVAWTAQNIARYGGDTQRVCLGGHSAGGHLASLVIADESYLKAVKVAPTFIKGVIGVSGVYRWFAAATSPIAFVRAGLPPFLLIYAEKDLPLLSGMARDFAAALKKWKNQVNTLEVANRDHESVMFEATTSTDPVAQAILKFVIDCAPAR